MENVVFTQLSIRELRSLFREELEQFHKENLAKVATRQEEPPGQAGDAYINKRQAARLLSCSTSTIDNYARAGALTRHYIGKAVRFDRQEVLALARKHSTTKQRTQ